MAYYFTCPECLQYSVTDIPAKVKDMFEIVAVCPHCGFKIDAYSARLNGISLPGDDVDPYYTELAELSTYLLVRGADDPICELLFACLMGESKDSPIYRRYKSHRDRYLKESFGEDAIGRIESDDVLIFMSDMVYRGHNAGKPLDPRIEELLGKVKTESYREAVRYCLDYITGRPLHRPISELEDIILSTDSKESNCIMNLFGLLPVRYDHIPTTIEGFDKGWRPLLDVEGIVAMERLFCNSESVRRRGSNIGMDTSAFAELQLFLMSNLDDPLVLVVCRLLLDCRMFGVALFTLIGLVDAKLSENTYSRILDRYGEDKALEIYEDGNRMKAAIERYKSSVIGHQFTEYDEMRKRIISYIAALDRADLYSSMFSHYGILYKKDPEALGRIEAIASETHSLHLHSVLLDMLLGGDLESRCQVKGYWDVVIRASLREVTYGGEFGYKVLNVILNRKNKDRISALSGIAQFIGSFGVVGDALNLGVLSGAADKAAEASGMSAFNLLYRKAGEVARANRNLLKRFDDHPEALFLLGVSYKDENPSKSKKYVEKALKKGLQESDFLMKAYDLSE